MTKFLERLRLASLESLRLYKLRDIFFNRLETNLTGEVMESKLFSYHLDRGWSDNENAVGLDSKNSLIVAFFSPLIVKEKKAFLELKKKFPLSQVIGCSTSGEIYQDHVRDRSLTCCITKFKTSSFKVVETDISAPENSFLAGETLGKQLLSSDLKGVLVLSDGMNTDGSELARGLNSSLKNNEVTVSGGMAGDGSDFQTTYILNNDGFISSKIAAVGFYGNNLIISHGSKGGWDIFGPKRTVTKSEGNILYELDGRPALELYKKYLGDKAKDLPASGLFFPLEISIKGADKKLVRTILGVNEETQSLTFAGAIPEGVRAQLMTANLERIIDGAYDASFQANQGELDQIEGDSIIFAISCVGRRLVLGPRVDNEIEAVNESSKNCKVIGFYSYGELASTCEKSPCELHNQTMTIMKISEKAKL